MKVTNGTSQSLQQAQAQSEAKNIKSSNLNRGQATQLDPTESAQVSLSKRAQQIKTATEIAKDDSVDEAKIARFQSLIDSGKYQMDAAKIADRLVDDHLKMPS